MGTSHLSSSQPPSAQPGSVCVCADSDVFLAKPLGESLQLQLFGEREDLRPLVFPTRSIFAFRAYYAFSIFSHQDIFFSESSEKSYPQTTVLLTLVSSSHEQHRSCVPCLFPRTQPPGRLRAPPGSGFPPLLRCSCRGGCISQYSGKRFE